MSIETRRRDEHCVDKERRRRAVGASIFGWRFELQPSVGEQTRRNLRDWQDERAEQHAALEVKHAAFHAKQLHVDDRLVRCLERELDSKICLANVKVGYFDDGAVARDVQRWRELREIEAAHADNLHSQVTISETIEFVLLMFLVLLVIERQTPQTALFEKIKRD